MPSKQPLASQENAVLTMIRDNPFVAQQDIATALALARSTVAAHIVALMDKGYILGRGYVLASQTRAVCVGGAVLDRKYHARSDIVLETSNPVDSVRSWGGVARNVAENLARLGTSTSFVSIVGEDDAGQALLRYMRELGVDVSQVVTTRERPTAEYAAILDVSGELTLGIADMNVFDLLSPDHIEKAWPHLGGADWVFADCNLPPETLSALLRRRGRAACRVAVDTVSTHKAVRLPQDLHGIDLLFTNMDEATAMLQRAGEKTAATPEDAARALQRAGAQTVIVTAGAAGLAAADPSTVRFLPAVKAHPVDMTGAGDAMIAATLHCLLNGDDIFEAARAGALLAALTTECEASVHTELSQSFLQTNRHRLA